MGKQIDIEGIKIENVSYEDILCLIKEKLSRKETFTLNYVNAFILLQLNKNEDFRKIINSFSFLYNDGIGIYFASKFLYGKNSLKQRITGTDLYYYILDYANKMNLKCFFFGGGEESIKLLPGVLKLKYPNIIIAGMISRDLTENKLIIEKIKNSNADILFVGIGTPHQEKWISKYSKIIGIPIQLSVGSGIDFISGYRKRAPKYIQKIGLEWLYRIFLEPGRLWKRYIFGIPIFVFKILILKFKLLFKRGN